MHRLGRIKTRIRERLARAVLALHGHLLPAGLNEAALPELVDAQGRKGDARDDRIRRDTIVRISEDLSRIAEVAGDEDVAELESTCEALLTWMGQQTSVEFWRRAAEWQTREFVLAAGTHSPATEPSSHTMHPDCGAATEPDRCSPGTADGAAPVTPLLPSADPSPSPAVPAGHHPAPAQVPGDGQTVLPTQATLPPFQGASPATSLSALLASRTAGGSATLVDGAFERTRSASPVHVAPRASGGAESTEARRPSGGGPTVVLGRAVYLPGDRPHVPPVVDLEKALRDLPRHVPPSSVKAPPGARLRVEIVPVPCRSTGIERLLAPEVRTRMAVSVATASGASCRGCGARLGPESRCREVFHYDDASRHQTLVDVVALCARCFELDDLIARAPVDGRYIEAIEHLMDVNAWDQSTAEKYANSAAALAEWRSRHEWTTDLTYLEKLCVAVSREDLERAIAAANPAASPAGTRAG